MTWGYFTANREHVECGKAIETNDLNQEEFGLVSIKSEINGYVTLEKMKEEKSHNLSSSE